jgi:hypothetical protein
MEFYCGLLGKSLRFFTSSCQRGLGTPMDNIPGKKCHEHTFYMESSFHRTQHTRIDETMTEENVCVFGPERPCKQTILQTRFKGLDWQNRHIDETIDTGLSVLMMAMMKFYLSLV